jgi:hypothetical protein
MYIYIYIHLIAKGIATKDKDGKWVGCVFKWEPETKILVGEVYDLFFFFTIIIQILVLFYMCIFNNISISRYR